MGKTFAIGDIHGCYKEMMRALEFIQSQCSSGKVVFLGDYIDRGEDSQKVISHLMAGPPAGWEWVCLKGNHEDMMVSSVSGEDPIEWWLKNGGRETVQSYGGEIPVSHLEWCKKLPLIHVDTHRVFVHAGIDQTVPVSHQSEKTMLWSRQPPTVAFAESKIHVVHGHTPEKVAFSYGNVTNLDSGCVFGGGLSFAEFDDKYPGAPLRLFNTHCLTDEARA